MDTPSWDHQWHDTWQDGLVPVQQGVPAWAYEPPFPLPGAPPNGVLTEASVWHHQTLPDDCAVVAQEFVLEQLTGSRVGETELVREATDCGWYDHGTSMLDIGNLLELHGIGVERSTGNHLTDLEDLLAADCKVIAGVDSSEIWSPQNAAAEQWWDTALPGAPDHAADHAVQVLAVDRSDPANPMVVINDPGHPNGGGLAVPADVFVGAWEDSDCYLVATTGYAPAPPDVFTAVHRPR